MSFTSEFVQANGLRLHYLHWASDGPPLVIVHGTTHCGGVYAPLAEALWPDFSVYAIDLRGHGLSEKGDAYSWAMLRDDIAGMLDALDLHEVLMVAHSRGGGASLLAAAMRPERVRGVLAFEPNVPLQHWHSESIEQRVADLVARAERRRSTWPDRESMYNHFLGRGAFKDWQDEFLRAFVAHASIDLPDGTIGLASPTDVEREMYREIFNFEEWSKIQACPVPALAIYGAESGRIKPGEDPVSELRKLYVHVDIEVMANASHSGPMEHPARFEQYVRTFAESLAPD